MNSSQKNLLVIGYVWPEPNSSAAGARMLQLIQCFQTANYQVTYASPAAPSEHAIDYEQYGITTATIELNDSSFDKYITKLKPDAVMFDRFMMEEQFSWRVEKFAPNAIRLLDTEDLHCLRFARQALAKGNDDVIQDVPIEHLYSDHAKREIAAIYRCDLSIMISSYEMQLLTEAFNVPEQLLIHTPFLIKDIQTKYKSYDDRQYFVSIGNFRHEPNWDAVLQLKKNIWPLIRKKLPKVELHIYGAYPPKKATQLHNEKQGFHVKGWCEDAFEVLQNGKVLLAPLRFGAGLKGKMLDAAQCGLPAVTTTIGAEGLFDDHEYVTCKVSNDPIEFANFAVELYENQQHWKEHQGACIDFLKQGFEFEEHCSKFLKKIDYLENSLAEHRLTNFTGGMLRHHSMKSTQYMAQWIEAKNKLPKD